MNRETLLARRRRDARHDLARRVRRDLRGRIDVADADVSVSSHGWELVDRAEHRAMASSGTFYAHHRRRKS